DGDPPSSHPSTRDPARASGGSGSLKSRPTSPKWASPTSPKGGATPSPIA
ncbi:uncharacterized protein SCHCODRAFT_02501094, partial [Schizophyllum commune H4-8]